MKTAYFLVAVIARYGLSDALQKLRLADKGISPAGFAFSWI
jgi:hypothetical protein